MDKNIQNVIFITIDCLRADYVNEKISPNICKIANSGVIFKNAIATGSWTPASFKSIFASVYPFNDNGELSVKKHVTLAEILKKNGYKTIAIQDNPWLSKMYGYNKGFDVFIGNLTSPKEGNRKFSNLINLLKYIYIKLDPKHKLTFITAIYSTLTKQNEKTAEHLTQYALDELKNTAQPFFMWVHYLDAHEPYYPRNANIFKKLKYIRLNKVTKNATKVSKSDINILKDGYISEINNIDKNISSILDYIESSELKGNTYVVITSDHGQQFFEHGGYGHGMLLYEELIHVPLIFRGPNIKKDKVESVFSNINLAPTILGLLGIKANSSFMGQNLSNLLVNSSSKNIKSINSFAISEEGRNQRSTSGINTNLENKYMRISCRTDDWKYIYNKDCSDELYNLKDDSLEKINIIGMQDSVCIKLNRLINQHIKFRKEHGKNNEKDKIKKIIKRIKE